MTLTAVNLVLCLCIAWACLCRLNASDVRVLRKVRLAHVLLLAGAVSSGFAPALWGERPGLGAVVLAGCVLAVLVIGMDRWRAGAPRETRTCPGDLGPPEGDR